MDSGRVQLLRGRHPLPVSHLQLFQRRPPGRLANSLPLLRGGIRRKGGGAHSSSVYSHLTYRRREPRCSFLQGHVGNRLLRGLLVCIVASLVVAAPAYATQGPFFLDTHNQLWAATDATGKSTSSPEPPGSS